MLRPFPPPNASKRDFKIFQSESDALLRSVSSLAIPIPKPAPKTDYDESHMANLTNLSSEILAQLQDKVNQQAVFDRSIAGIKSYAAIAAKSADIKNRASQLSDDSDSGFILKLIFDIIPIGVNIAAKGSTIAAGLKDTSMGIVNALKNISLLIPIAGRNFFEFVIQFFIYMFKLLLCTVQLIRNFPYCVFFYWLDVMIFSRIVWLLSILFIIDVFLMVKSWSGTSCIELFIMLLTYLEILDNLIYSNAGIHIIHYPDSIINRCYTCSTMGDTSKMKDASQAVLGDLLVGLPSNIGGPFGDTINGIGEIFSFFDI